MSEDNKEESNLNQYDQVSDDLGKTLGMLELQNKQLFGPKIEQIINYLENQTILLNNFIEQAPQSNSEQVLNYLENQTILLNQLNEQASKANPEQTLNHLENQTIVLNQLNEQASKVNPEQTLNYLENQTIVLNQLNEQASKANPELVLNYLKNQTAVLNQLASDENQTVSDSEKLNKQILGTLAVNALQTRQQRDYNIDHELAKKTNYKKAKGTSFEETLTNLKALMPHVFDAWLKCYETGSAAYQKDPHGSCSVWGEAYAEGFRNFCSGFLKGRVLDVGSGPIGKPVYLQGYPSSLISAIEPLEVEANIDFELVRGFNEALPWPDKSFNTILNATSLDHVLSLDKAMEETHRVLADEGRFIIWIGSIPGAKPYDPNKKGFKPIDEFHLFHIDQKWFEPYISKWFEIEEKLLFPTQSFSHVYYVFSKKNV